MTNKKNVIIFFINIFIIVISMSSFASAYKEYRKSMLNDAVKNMNMDNKKDMIFSWDDVQPDNHAYKKALVTDIVNAEGEDDTEEEKLTKAEIIKFKNSTVKMINTSYTFKVDNEGHRAIAYVDEETNEPIIAIDGFYVVKKVYPSTDKVRYVKYYADLSGYLQSGWIEVENKKYYLLKDELSFGEVVTGDVTSLDGDVFSFDEEGVFIGVK